ncbi:MAG: transglutaminase-like domain-containing protein [Thermoplasmata archaeon]
MNLMFIHFSLTGNISINGEMSADNVTVQVSSHWTGELGILLERGSTAVINNTLFFSSVDEEYFDIEVLGTAKITNATFAHINNGLIINSPNVEISDIGIHYCNEYGMQIISSDISITDSIIINNNGADIRIEGSTVVMTDCDFNRSKVEVVDGTLSARGNMVIRVINENSENVSDAQVLVKDLEQSLIYSGATDANGIVTIEGKIFEMVAEGGKTGTFFKTPYTIIVKKDGLSNVSKLRNIGPDMAREEHVIMLREESEWDHVWMTDFRMRVPEGIAGAFSSGPHQDGMSFCAHIINEEEGAIEVLLRSYDPVSMENDNDDLFYNAYIYDENGNSMGGPCIGWGVLEIESSQLPAGHYDVIWKYYNDADGSEIYINASEFKIVFVSSDAININVNVIQFPKEGQYPINISYNCDINRAIYLRGYIGSFDNDINVQYSHLSNVKLFNNTYAEIKTDNGNYIYANSQFGYYLGDENELKNINFYLNIESSSYSKTIFNIYLSYMGWQNPKVNDLNCNGISDWYDSEIYGSGTGGRDDSLYYNPNLLYIKYQSSFNTELYKCWIKGDNNELIAIPIYGAVIRRGERINNNDIKDIKFYIYSNGYYPYSTVLWYSNPYKTKFHPDGPRPISIGPDGTINTYYSINTIHYLNQNGEQRTKWEITISKSHCIGTVYFTIYYTETFYSSDGEYPKLKIHFHPIVAVFPINLIFEFPKYVGNTNYDYSSLTEEGLKCYNYNYDDISYKYFTESMYCDGYEENIKFRVEEHKTNFPNYPTYKLNQLEVIVFSIASKISIGSINSHNAAKYITNFVDYIMRYKTSGSAPTKDIKYIFEHYHVQYAITEEDIDNAISGKEEKKSKDQFEGECGDYANMACSLLRSLGVPSRTVVGTWTSVGDYHVWVEYWGPTNTGEYAWFVLDPTELPNKNVVGISTRNYYIYGPPDADGAFTFSSYWLPNGERVISSSNGNTIEDFDNDKDLIILNSFY